VYNYHKSYTDRGEGDYHPWGTYAAELCLLLKILTKAQNNKSSANRKGDKTNKQIV